MIAELLQLPATYMVTSVSLEAVGRDHSTNPPGQRLGLVVHVEGDDLPETVYERWLRPRYKHVKVEGGAGYALKLTHVDQGS